MAGGPERGPLRQFLDTVGSPVSVTILAVIVSVGLATVFAMSWQSSRDDRRAADRAEALQEITDRTIDLLAAVERERGLGHLMLLRTNDGRRARYEDAIVATDRVIVAHAGTLDRLGLRLDPLARSDDVLVPLGELPSVRQQFMEESAVQGDLLYSSVTRPIREWLADQTFSASSVEQVRLRRANNALLAALEAAGRRRVLVITALAGRELPDDLRIELSIIHREFQASVAQATGLVSVPTDTGVDLVTAVGGLLDAQVSGRVVAGVDAVLGGLPAQQLPDLLEWFDESAVQMESLVSLIGAVHDQIQHRVSAEAQAAGAQGQQVGTLILFLLSLVVGGSAIASSHHRVAALHEYEGLESGVREWFLPEALPDIDGLEFEARYLTAASHADSGGDWYDAFVMPDGATLLVIGDVAGHSPTAVSHMVEVRNVLRGVACATNGEPARILELVDGTVRSGHFTTAFVARLSSDLETLTFSRAGHMPAVLQRADGTAVLLEGDGDLPIGVDRTVARHQSSWTLQPGELIVLFTDGLVDRPDAYLPDELKAVRELVAGFDAELPLTVLADRLQAHRSPTSPDDCSILVVRCGRPEERKRVVAVHGQADEVDDGHV